MWPRFQSVNETTLIDPTSDPTPFPAGWGGANFAQHHQGLDPTGDQGDITDQIKQGIDGSRVVPDVPVNVSFRYINTEPGRLVRVQVYGINMPQVWSEFASWSCQFPQFGPAEQTCTLLYQADMPLDYTNNQGWKDSGVGTFTPTESYDVIAVGISLGGNKGYARGVDDVVLTQNRPPVCDAAYPSAAVLWPPNHQFVPIDILGVTDPDDDPVTIKVVSIYQDEPVNAVGDGNTSPDAEGINTERALVRAERAGGGNGRVYHIGFSANDGNGGTCTGTVQVSVPKSQGKNGAAVDEGPSYDSTTPPPV